MQIATKIPMNIINSSIFILLASPLIPSQLAAKLQTQTVAGEPGREASVTAHKTAV